LKLRPNYHKSDLIRQAVVMCKEELAKDVPLGNISSQLQGEINNLISSNKLLKAEVERLQQQLARATPAPMSNPVASLSQERGQPGPDAVAGVASAAALTREPAASEERPGSTRNYRVRRGDTLYSIARRHGVSTAALQAANPGVNPSRLRIDQVLQIPPQ
jgi:LysM repeat protein